MKSFHSLFVSATAAAVVAGCSPVNVDRDYSLSYDFGQLDTYQWHPDGPLDEDYRELGNDILHERIHEAVDNILEGKDYTRSDNPDFYVNYSVVTEKRVDVERLGRYDGYYPRIYGHYHFPLLGDRRYWGGFAYDYRGPVTDLQYYTYRTLILDIIDAESKRLVWRATAEHREPGKKPRSTLGRGQEVGTEDAGPIPAGATSTLLKA